MITCRLLLRGPDDDAEMQQQDVTSYRRKRKFFWRERAYKSFVICSIEHPSEASVSLNLILVLICLFIYLFICLFVYLFICLFVYLFMVVALSLCMFLYFTPEVFHRGTQIPFSFPSYQCLETISFCLQFS